MKLIYFFRFVVFGLLIGLVLLCSSCKGHSSLPGAVLLSSPSWDHISYFDGVAFRDIKVEASVAAAKGGPGGHVYALTGLVKSQAGSIIRNYLAELRPDGSTIPIFDPPNSVLSFSTTPTALVVLAYKADERCPTLYWVHYEGTVLRTMAAPCSSENPEAISEDKILLTAYDPVANAAPKLLLLHGNRFEDIGEGYGPAWTNQTQFLYQDAKKRCIYKRVVGESAGSRVLCDAFFEGAASADSRYLVVHVPATAGPFGLTDTKELRIVDTRTGHYITIYRGAPPSAFWLN